MAFRSPYLDAPLRTRTEALVHFRHQAERAAANAEAWMKHGNAGKAAYWRAEADKASRIASELDESITSERSPPPPEGKLL